MQTLIKGDGASLRNRDKEVVLSALPAYIMLTVGQKAAEAGFQFRADFAEHLRRHIANAFKDVDELSQLRLSNEIAEHAKKLMRDVPSDEPVVVLCMVCYWILEMVDNGIIKDVQSMPVLYSLLVTNEAQADGNTLGVRVKYAHQKGVEIFSRARLLQIY